MLKRPRTSIPTFSSSTATSADLSIGTEMTIDTMTNQNTLIDVEMDEVLKTAMVDISHYIVRLLHKQSKQNVSTISKYIRAMIAEINPSTSYI